MTEKKTIHSILECDPACITTQQIAERYGFVFDCDCIDIKVKDLDRLFADPAGCDFARIVAGKKGITVRCPETDPAESKAFNMASILECSEECLNAQEAAKKFGIELDCECVNINVNDLIRLFQEPAGCELAKIIAGKHGVEIICPEEE